MGNNNSTKHINDTMNNEVAEKTTIPSKKEAATKLKLEERKVYIEADAYIADPYALLGQVIQVRKVNGECPANFNEAGARYEFTPIPVKRKVNENSKLKKPEIRSSIVVDKNLSANVSFLSYLSAELSEKSVFSVTLLDQAAGLVDTHHDEWSKNIREWKTDNNDLMDDPEICYLFVVTGFIQKNLMRKKYYKFEAGAKGGGFGINVNGELATSTEEYSLDIWFGLEVAVIKRPAAKSLESATINDREIKLLQSATGSTLIENAIVQKLTL